MIIPSTMSEGRHMMKIVPIVKIIKPRSTDNTFNGLATVMPTMPISIITAHDTANLSYIADILTFYLNWIIKILRI